MSEIDLEFKSDREILVAIYTKVVDLREEMNDHEGRMRSLENYKSWATGAWTVLGGLIALFAQWLPWGWISRNK